MGTNPMDSTRKRTFKFLPLTLRLGTLGDIATPLVLRGTPLPARRSNTFSTAADNQGSVETDLFLGESPLAQNNIKLGKLRLEGIPALPRGFAKIKVEFAVDTSCTVTARANVEGMQQSAQEIFAPPIELSESFIAEMLAKAESSRPADEAELQTVEDTNKAKDLIERAEKKLAQGGDTKLDEAVAALGLALASGNNGAIREKSDALAGLLPAPTTDFSSIFGTDFFGPMFASPKSTPRVANPAKTSAPAVAPTRKSDPISPQKLASQAPERVLGKIFGGASFTLDTQLCFVLMPFDTKLQPLYDDHIRPTVSRAGLKCERADDIQGTAQITWDIWERINRARFLIAELTGQNPNVFYELGLAHALSKDVILITQSMDFVPFDLKPIRCVVYDFTPRGTQKLESGLTGAIDSLMKSL
ncbi:MAG TPA: Hsp70 family protein [Terriglobales bacterium]|nr:Hsp70 family protein [Terriglobales bacterium]